MSDLRERVAKAMCDAVNVEGTWEETGTLHREKVWFVSADAAIALVLEEAAKVADDEACYCEDTGSAPSDFGNAGRNDAARTIAAAIRALKER